jgi:predicted AlkP superfamily phosphohydrolase/phosphomutase
MKRTLAIGLEGCSWNMLEPLLASGRLPHLAELCSGGAVGVLESTVPYHPAPAWATYATSTAPTTHGVYDTTLVGEDHRLHPLTPDTLAVPTYFDYLGRTGRRSVLVNLPLDLQGSEGCVVVNSWLTDDDARRVLPLGRRERYSRLVDAYRTVPNDPRDLSELCAIEEARFDLARELFLSESWDHFFVLFSSTDWLAHRSAGALLAGDRDAFEAFARLLGQLDEYIGWLVERADGAAVAIVSAHGQTEERAILRINSVLRKLGLADGSVPVTHRDERRGVRATIPVPPAISRGRFNPLLRPAALLTNRALRRGLRVELSAALRELDIARSAAFCPTDTSFAIYTNPHREVDVDALRDALLDLRLDDGTPALEAVWSPEELFGATPTGHAPALFFEPAQGVRPSSSVKDRAIDRPAGRGIGCHQREGILVLSGDDLVAGDLGRVPIVDVAPTLLSLMGAGVPATMDGEVSHRALNMDALPMGQPLDEQLNGGQANGEIHDLSGELAERLKALGYL